MPEELSALAEFAASPGFGATKLVIAAVVLLGLMAYRLSRQVSKSPELADRRRNKN